MHRNHTRLCVDWVAYLTDKWKKNDILNPKIPLNLSVKGLKMVVNRHQSKREKN